MTDFAAIRATVHRLAARRVASGALAPANDVSLVGEGALDSLAFVELVAELEKEFEVEIDLLELEADEVTTLDGLAGRIAAALAVGGGAQPGFRHT